MSPNKKRTQPGDNPVPNADRQPESMPTFRTRLEAGDYDAILGRKLRRTLRAAAHATGLDDEVGALRLTLVRLLQEEHDPCRLATSVSRIAGIAVQAARLRQRPDSGLDEIQKIMLRELEALEAEHAQQAKKSAVPYIP